VAIAQGSRLPLKGVMETRGATNSDGDGDRGLGTMWPQLHMIGADHLLFAMGNIKMKCIILSVGEAASKKATTQVGFCGGSRSSAVTVQRLICGPRVCWTRKSVSV
jgi:hypothetical protein